METGDAKPRLFGQLRAAFLAFMMMIVIVKCGGRGRLYKVRSEIRSVIDQETRLSGTLPNEARGLKLSNSVLFRELPESG